jgi:cobalt/nickel transport system permease protein
LIGIGEGLITAGAIAFLSITRSDLLKANQATARRGNLVWVVGLLMAILLAVASPLASRHPDGLMSVASQYGFLSSEQNPIYQLIPHYRFPGLQDKTLATILAALLGTLIVFGVALGVAHARRRKTKSHDEPQA